MTRDEKPLRLTTRRPQHAAGASRRIAFGVSAATAAFLTSLMAQGRAEPAAAPPVLFTTTTTTAPEPLIVHVQVTRPWTAQATTRARSSIRQPAVAAPAPPGAAQSAPPSSAQPAPPPVVTAAPPTAPPTTATRAS